MFSIDAELYYPIYISLMLFMCLIYFYQLNHSTYSSTLTSTISYYPMLLVTIFLILFLGYRPISVLFADTISYANNFQGMKTGLERTRNLTKGDLWFSLLMYQCAQIMNIHEFYLLIEILYFVPLVIACWRLNKEKAPILLLFVFVCYSFFSYAVNGIRNGMACSLIILALSLIQGNWWQKIISALLCVIAVNFHHSMALPIIAMALVYFYRKPKAMFYFWVLSILISLFFGNTMANFFASLGFDDRLSNTIYNAEKNASYFSRTGFRWDFLLYSVMPIWLGWYVIFKKKIWNDTYIILLGTYIYSNAFWVMVIRASFSNRFAYLSWFLYGIVLAYPLLKFPIWKSNRGMKTALVLMANFGFTLFMWLIGK